MTPTTTDLDARADAVLAVVDGVPLEWFSTNEGRYIQSQETFPREMWVKVDGAFQTEISKAIVTLRNDAPAVIRDLRAARDAAVRERDILWDSTHRDRTLNRPAGDYPEFMLQAFLNSGIAGTSAAKQAGALLTSLRQQITDLEQRLAAAERERDAMRAALVNARIGVDWLAKEGVSIPEQQWAQASLLQIDAALTPTENADGK